MSSGRRLHKPATFQRYLWLRREAERAVYYERQQSVRSTWVLDYIGRQPRRIMSSITTW